MIEVVLYIATSIDGYIATPDGGVDWLAPVEAAARAQGEDYGYADFYESVDALVMGSRTYEQVLGFGAWPYPDKPCRVFSARDLPLAEAQVALRRGDPGAVLAELEALGARRVWLVGGARLAASFAVRQLISEHVISVVPCLLGQGIRLFQEAAPAQALHLESSRAWASGLVQLRYLRRTDGTPPGTP